MKIKSLVSLVNTFFKSNTTKYGRKKNAFLTKFAKYTSYKMSELDFGKFFHQIFLDIEMIYQ